MKAQATRLKSRASAGKTAGSAKAGKAATSASKSKAAGTAKSAVSSKASKNARPAAAKKAVVAKRPVSKAAPVKAKASVAKPKTGAAVKKAAPTPARKAVAKPITKATGAAKNGKPVPKPAASKVASPVKSVTKAKAPPLKPESKPVKSAAPAVPVTSVPVPLPVAPRARSARAQQLTAPSMAPAVASTAAKASYTHSPMPSTNTFVPAAQLPIKKDPKLANNWKTRPVDQLTDADILAMPDSEYMNDAQMAFFRLKLVQLKQDILNSADETTEHLREDTVIVPDPADRATIEEEHALELRTRDRERKLLKKIEQSIGRIDAGDYGYCDETGEPIGVGRLLARPTATLSLEAQQRRELKQKMFGD